MDDDIRAYWGAPVCSKAKSIAARLAEATGADVRREEASVGIRLEVDLPRDLSEASRRAVLAAIANAEAYGHRRTGDSDCLWALVIHEAEEDPGDR
jgi:hypothetical protein